MRSFRFLALMLALPFIGQTVPVRAQTYGMNAKAIIPADDLLASFKQVCLDSSGTTEAINRATALPQSQRAPQDKRPGSYRVYETPNLSVGIFGGRYITCYVIGFVGSEENADRVVGSLETMRGKPLKIGKSNSGVRYASWRDHGLIFRFEDSLRQPAAADLIQEPGHFVLLSVQNKKG